MTSDPEAARTDGPADAVGLRERLLAGDLDCAGVARAFLEALGADHLNAWAAVDPDALAARAEALDRLDPPEKARLPLFGVPIGVKDNLDTADLPTAYGSPAYAEHRPRADAAAVRLLRAGGAMIAGKTKCTEFAWMFPTDTRNPRDPTRTPGGSSSGSAAAVAAGTVPVALGTQTAGSVNRPASYCGVLGYKPTFGSFPRAGVKPLSASLDTVGLFARSIRDLRLVAAVLAGGDPADPTLRRSQPFDPGGCRLERPPRLALARTPDWARVEPETQAAIEAAAGAARAAGATVEEIDLPPGFTHLVAAHVTIQLAETAIALAPERDAWPELLSDDLTAAIERGAAITPEEYAGARRDAAALRPAVTAILAGAHDCVLTPSTSGVPPPLRLGHTGDPHFCRAWTLIGAPCVSVPLAWTASVHLPAGIQVVGAPYRDASTLACAAWLLDHAAQPAAAL